MRGEQVRLAEGVAPRGLAPIMCLALLLALVLALAAPQAGTIDGPMARVHAVRHAGMTVSDMAQALGFYTGILPFTVEYDVEMAGRPWELLHGVFGARSRVVGLRLGDERLELTQYLAPRGRPMPDDSRGNDQWFQHVAIIVRDMDVAYAYLRQHEVEHASTGPQRLPDWNPGAGGIEAFYFRDPDGHFLEVLAFPPDKGHPKWRRAGGNLFLGIDHTAIVSTDTARSVAFYRDTLGLDVAGAGVNHGIEQEHLNNVFGVRLRITTLRAAEGPGVELLEYLAPGDGRATPHDIKANDIAHWQITMDAKGTHALLEPSRLFSLVSPDVVTLESGRQLGITRGLMVRDPDGHAVRLVE